MDQTKESADKNGDMTKQAGKFALVFTTLLAVSIILLMAFQVYTIESKFVRPGSGLEFLSKCPPATCSENTLRIYLEQDAQNLRTDRFRSAMTTRLTVHVVAEVIALVLVVLGAVLIFDRIEGNHTQGLSVNTGTGPNYKAQLINTFPGLFLCLFGTIVISWSLWVVSQPKSRVTIYDYPVFVNDANFFRNSNGLLSGHVPGLPEDPNPKDNNLVNQAFPPNEQASEEKETP